MHAKVRVSCIQNSFSFNYCAQSNLSAMAGVSAPSDGGGSGTFSELTRVNLGSAIRTDKSPTALDVMATPVNTRGHQTPETTYQLQNGVSKTYTKGISKVPTNLRALLRIAQPKWLRNHSTNPRRLWQPQRMEQRRTRPSPKRLPRPPPGPPSPRQLLKNPTF